MIARRLYSRGFGSGGDHRGVIRPARIRRARKSFEYPTSTTPGPISEDVDDAAAVATEVHKAAATILNQDVLTRW